MKCQHLKRMGGREAEDGLDCGEPATHRAPEPWCDIEYLCPRHASGCVRSFATTATPRSRPIRLPIDPTIRIGYK